jgi:hypothetical protein
MKGRLMGALVAVTLGAASQAHALSIFVGNIIPPGGNAESAMLRDGTLGIFGAPSGINNYMDAAAITAIAGVVGSSTAVNVFAVNTNLGTALIMASTAQFSLNADSASPGAVLFQSGSTGGMSAIVGSPGVLAAGGLNATSGIFAAALVGLGANTTGSATLTKGSTANVRFLSWNGDAWTVDRTSNYASNGSLNFNFEVLPLPAPLAIAGLGLVGAGVLRRRMSKV